MAPGMDDQRRDDSGLRLRVAVLLVLLALPALGQAMLEAERGEWPGVLDLFRRPPNETHLRAVESDLEDASFLVRWARRHWAPRVDAVLDRGNGRVIFGRGDWLFYRPAVEMVAAPAIGSPSAELEGPKEAILDWYRQLAARDVALVLVAVPVKATAHAEYLADGVDSDSWPDNSGVASLLADLETAGVTVVDVDAVLQTAKAEGQRLFLPRDTHWTPWAMRRVAEATAETIRGLPTLDAHLGPAEPFDHRQLRVAGWGDLVGMLGYAPRGAADPGGDRFEGWDRPELEAMAVELFQVVATAEGRAPIVDRGAGVLLLGDSLSGIYSQPELGFGRGAGFGEQLADALGASIERIAIPAGGARRAREVLALDPGRLVGKRVVVWQLTRRDLLWGEWPRIELPATPDTVDDASERRGARRVVAIVEEASRPPRRLDYEECLTLVRYRRLDGDSVVEGGQEFFVAHVGWRDFAPTEAAEFGPGEVHALDLVPMPANKSLENTCWVDTVGLDQEPWFARSFEQEGESR